MLARVNNTRVSFLSQLRPYIVLFRFLFSCVRNCNTASHELRAFQHDVTWYRKWDSQSCLLGCTVFSVLAPTTRLKKIWKSPHVLEKLQISRMVSEVFTAWRLMHFLAPLCQLPLALMCSNKTSSSDGFLESSTSDSFGSDEYRTDENSNHSGFTERSVMQPTSAFKNSTCAFRRCSQLSFIHCCIYYLRPLLKMTSGNYFY